MSEEDNEIPEKIDITVSEEDFSKSLETVAQHRENKAIHNAEELQQLAVRLGQLQERLQVASKALQREDILVKIDILSRVGEQIRKNAYFLTKNTERPNSLGAMEREQDPGVQLQLTQINNIYMELLNQVFQAEKSNSK